MKTIFLTVFAFLFCSIFAELTFLSDIMYYKYSNNKNFKSGTYESFTLNNRKGSNIFSIFISEQKTNGKTDLSKIYDLKNRETWIDSVYYSNPDTIFVNPFYDSTSVYQDTMKYDKRDIFQNEIFLSFEHKFSQKYASGLEFKYSSFENSRYDFAVMLASNHRYEIGKFSFNSNFAFSKIKYETKSEVEWIIIDEQQYTTFDDTTYAFQPDSVVTTIIEEYNIFEEITEEQKLNTIQFSQKFSYLYKNLLLDAGIDIYRILKADEFDDKINSHYHFDAGYYSDYFGFFGGFSKGEKFLLQTYNNKFLNTTRDFDLNYSLGMIVYPFLRNWSISYQYKKNYYDTYQVDTHLLNFYFKLK